MIWPQVRRGVPAALAAVLAAALAGCGSGGTTSDSSPRGYGTVTVLAASSLTAAFGQLAQQFDRAHPGTVVKLSFGGSSTLAEQIINGAPADVFASADQANMSKVTGAGLISSTPRVFARNVLEIVVAPGNPHHIHSLADLDRPGLVITLAGPSVPAGRYARQAFAKAGVKVPDASQETDVTQVITEIELGQADAGVVYVTDVSAAGAKVSGVPITAADNIEASYPIGVVSGGPDTAGGRAFAAYVTSSAGQAVLAGYGFIHA